MKKDKNKETTEEMGDNEVVFEEDEESGFLSSIEQVKKLRDKLKACQAEKQEYLDGWQRARADIQNLKKEQASEREKTVKFAQEDLLFELLSVTDSFTMAFADKDAWGKVDQNWRQGIEYIYAQLKGVLEKNGITEISPLGEKFDHNEHTSIEAISTDDEKENEIVAEVVQNGYRLRGKVIRPARVKVTQYKPGE
ncbi:MAG: nucleotide exchange factor GrpE [Patescibacteria group bacterium]